MCNVQHDFNCGDVYQERSLSLPMVKGQWVNIVNSFLRQDTVMNKKNTKSFIAIINDLSI